MIWGDSKIIIKVLGILFSLVIIPMYGCNNHKLKVEPPGGLLVGTVRDSLSNLPIFLAWIGGDSMQNSLSTLTDTLGHYSRFAGLPGPARSLFCGKERYYYQQKDYSVNDAETITVDFNLVPSH